MGQAVFGFGLLLALILFAPAFMTFMLALISNPPLFIGVMVACVVGGIILK